MNKKKIFGLTTTALLAVTIAANVSIAKVKRGFSDISLANVEALANEGTIVVGKPCIMDCQMCWCMWLWDDGEVDEEVGRFSR